MDRTTGFSGTAAVFVAKQLRANGCGYAQSERFDPSLDVAYAQGGNELERVCRDPSGEAGMERSGDRAATPYEDQARSDT